MNEENIQNTAEQAATPAEQEPQQETNAAEGTDTQPQEQQPGSETPMTEQQEDGASAEETPAVSDEPFLVAKYLKEDKPLTREEAKDWAEKGMHYQSIYNELDYIAAQSGTDVKALVGNLRKQMEDGYRKSLEDKLGDDTETIEKLMTVYRNEQKDKYDKIVAEREEQKETSMSARLADEYIELKKRIPTVPEFKELPDTVKRDAAEGMNLTAAFLLYEHNEKMKIAAAQESAQAAQKASTGSMQSDSNSKTSEDEQYLAGLWGK